MAFLDSIEPPADSDRGPDREESRLIGEHYAYWKSLTEQGVALVVGRCQQSDPPPLGLAIFGAQDEDEARKIAGDDPAVVGGVFAHEIYPYQVSLLGVGAGFAPN